MVRVFLVIIIPVYLTTSDIICRIVFLSGNTTQSSWDRIRIGMSDPNATAFLELVDGRRGHFRRRAGEHCPTSRDDDDPSADGGDIVREVRG